MTDLDVGGGRREKRGDRKEKDTKNESMKKRESDRPASHAFMTQDWKQRQTGSRLLFLQLIPILSLSFLSLVRRQEEAVVFMKKEKVQRR